MVTVTVDPGTTAKGIFGYDPWSPEPAWSFPLRMNSGPMARSPGVGSRGIGGLGYPGNDSWAQDSVSGLPGLPIRPVAGAPVAMCRDDDGVVRWAALDAPPPVQPARIAPARMARADTRKRGWPCIWLILIVTPQPGNQGSRLPESNRGPTHYECVALTD